MNTTENPHEDDPRIFSDAEAERIVDRLHSSLNSTDELSITVQSVWFGRQRWARNRGFLTSNVRKVMVGIQALYAGVGGETLRRVNLNQVDDASLREVCRYLEECRKIQYRPGRTPGADLKLAHPTWPSKGIPVWSDVSYHRTASENVQVVADLTARAEAAGMQSSGSIETAGAHYLGSFRDSWGREERETGQATIAECSMTVRHPKGVGSGWAGASSFDLTRLDLSRLGEVALDKCMRSIDPVRIEPGRYQTILEPQAVATFATKFIAFFDSRPQAEFPGHPFFLEFDGGIGLNRSKLGLQIADRRLSISHNPEDPISGTFASPGMRTVDFVKDGIITELGRERDYAQVALARPDIIPSRRSFVMRGSETTTVEEMIATMKRGLLLTRVSGEVELDTRSALHTGVTRDGLWLIENGKITKAVRNFRWTESPLFIFNNIESIGESVPTMTSWFDLPPFSPHALHEVIQSPVVPTLKINDFSFTSTIDAV